MRGWLISVVGVILIGLLVDIIIPEGETNKYIKGIYALIVTIVIISPLPKLAKNDWKFDIDMIENSIEQDTEFTEYFNKQRLISDKAFIQSVVKLYEYENFEIEIECDDGKEYKLNKIVITIEGLKDKDKLAITKQIKSNFYKTEVIVSAK